MTDWNPNLLFVNQHEYRIYGDNKASIWAVVDEVDYYLLNKWLWLPKASRTGGKVYLRRNVETWIDGKRTQRTLFLHTAVMLNQGLPQPGPNFVVDHRNGDHLDCRRQNLRWVTSRFNALNRHGKLAEVEDEHALLCMAENGNVENRLGAATVAR